VIYDHLEAAVRRAAVIDIRDIVVDALLSEVIAGRSSLRAVRHPLGFFCLPVHRHGDEGICVHVWPDRPEPERLTTSPFHCHSWELLSHVLYGTVGNQLIEVTAGDAYRVFEARSGAAGDELVATPALVAARGLTPEYRTAGESYGLAAGVFHASVIANGSPAATVALGRHRPGQVDLTLGNPATLTHRVERERCSPAETRLIAGQLADRLADATTPDSAPLAQATAR